MPRPTLEVADVFRAHGQHWRDTHAGHLSLAQLKVMSSVEHCRSEVLVGHVYIALRVSITKLPITPVVIVIARSAKPVLRNVG